MDVDKILKSKKVSLNLMRRKLNQNFQILIFFYFSAQYVHVDKGRMWYREHLDLDKIGKDDIPESSVFNSMEYLKVHIEANNINALIGFSQGANMVITYLRLYGYNNMNIKFAIIISGYDFPRYQNIPIEIPILFIGSNEDDIVNINLKPINCINMTELIHEKGHIVPQRSSLITKVIEWIDISLKCAAI